MKPLAHPSITVNRFYFFSSNIAFVKCRDFVIDDVIKYQFA